MTVQISQVNMEGHSGSFICDRRIMARILCLLQRFEADSCVDSMILNIHWTCLVFGVIRQVGAYDDFELATAGPVLQDHWSLVLCTMHTLWSINAPLRPLTARTPRRRFRPARRHFLRPLHPASAGAQNPPLPH